MRLSGSTRSRRYRGCIKTFQSNSLNSWLVVKDVYSLVLSVWYMTPFLLTIQACFFWIARCNRTNCRQHRSESIALPGGSSLLYIIMSFHSHQMHNIASWVSLWGLPQTTGFSSFHPRSFSHIVVVGCPLFMIWTTSEMAQFCYVSVEIHR